MKVHAIPAQKVLGGAVLTAVRNGMYGRYPDENREGTSQPQDSRPHGWCALLAMRRTVTSKVGGTSSPRPRAFKKG